MQARGKIAIAIIGLIAVASIAAPLIAAHDPYGIDLDSLRTPPGGGGHILGTDQKGRDVLSRILFGARSSIGIAVSAALVSMGVGLLVGLVSGYYGGRVDAALMSLVDLVLSFPSLLLAIGISVVMPPGTYTVVIAIASVGWASFARLIRGRVLTMRESPLVESARVVGCGDGRIIFFHIMPECLPLAGVMAGLKLGGFIVAEASLSFLGLGAQPPSPAWGAMVSAGRAYILSAPWIALAPGIAIALAALCFNLAGDALSEKYGLRDTL